MCALMNRRVFAGAVLAYLYNDCCGRLPNRSLRHHYLRRWLGCFGKGSSVDMRCRFLNGRKVYLGERTVVNFGTVMDGRQHTIQTGHDVSIGPEAVLLTLGHDAHCPRFTDKGGALHIGSHAWIGYGALICPGVRIGEGAVVGAGSVVSRDVEPWTVVAGNPARKISDRGIEPAYQLHYAPFLL
jgi:acetyltransferase-like isoleucine patch superfamily enzyme